MEPTTPLPTPIPLKAGASKRFYEAVILLYCLGQVLPPSLPLATASTELAPTPENTKDLYQLFVDKLGQICDNRRGGDTVTAVSLLQHPDRIQYRFASNRRSNAELQCVRQYLERVLAMLKVSSSQDPSGDTQLQSRLLNQILAFNRPRLEIYIDTVAKNIDFCTHYVETGEQTGDTVASVAHLDAVKTAAVECAKDEGLSDPAFPGKCASLIRAIRRLHSSPAEALLRRKAEENLSAGSGMQWQALRHAANRLLSYLVAARTLLLVRSRWAQLFDNVEVLALPSSQPAEAPNVRRNAAAIISRMTSQKSLVTRCQDQAKKLQGGLDDTIVRKASPRNFSPIVHAELLVLESILDEAAASRPSEEDERVIPSSWFFLENPYIGCSKPTCLLCSELFQAHPSQVGVRSSHNNVYYNWTMPPVFAPPGSQAERTRDQLLEGMIQAVRKKAFACMLDNARPWKKHDSHTDPTLPRGLNVLEGSTPSAGGPETVMDELELWEEGAEA